MFGTALATALLAQTLPSMSVTCERDSEGNCLLNYEGGPLSRLHANDTANALGYYQPYFECYYARLIESDGFGSSDGAIATAAMLHAKADCAEEGKQADQSLDALLAERQVYGDEDRRSFVRELFRQEAGTNFVYATARANGLGAQVETMSKVSVEYAGAGQ